MICTFLRFFVYCFRLLLFVADSDGAELKTQLATNNRFPLAYTWTLNGWHAPHNRLAAQLRAWDCARILSPVPISFRAQREMKEFNGFISGEYKSCATLVAV